MPAPCFQTLEFWPSFYKCLNSGPMFVNNGIPALSFQTYLVFWPHSFKHGILALSLYTMEFWSHFYKHWNSGPFFQTFEFQPCFYKHWNSYLILTNLIQALSNQTLVFRPCPFKHGILALSLYTMEFWSHFYKHWNSGPFFQTFEFQPCFYKHWNSYLILTNLIQALSNQTLVFRPYPFKH